MWNCTASSLTKVQRRWSPARRRAGRGRRTCRWARPPPRRGGGPARAGHPPPVRGAYRRMRDPAVGRLLCSTRSSCSAVLLSTALPGSAAGSSGRSRVPVRTAVIEVTGRVPHIASCRRNPLTTPQREKMGGGARACAARRGHARPLPRWRAHAHAGAFFWAAAGRRLNNAKGTRFTLGADNAPYTWERILDLG
eukprot:gene23032-biopygen23793